MIDGLRVYAVIPARGGSRRLTGKNIAPLWGKPLLAWAIRACEASQYVDDCFVSTEDDEIANVAHELDAKLLRRPEELAIDSVFKQEVIVHAAQSFQVKPEIVVSLQANSPQICTEDLDGAIRKLRETGANEIFSVNKDLMQNAAFRVMKYDYVFQKSISTYCGVYITNYVDVHTVEDLAWLEENAQPCTHKKVKA